jgi:hypothetical protein
MPVLDGTVGVRKAAETQETPLLTAPSAASSLNGQFRLVAGSA